MNKGTYIVIDGLYLNRLRDYLCTPQRNVIDAIAIDKLRSDAFPYTDTPFGFVEFGQTNEFALNQIKKVNYDLIPKDKDDFFSTDTGLLLFINTEILPAFAAGYDFGKLVDLDPIDVDYWYAIIKDFNKSEAGLILSPGINFDFDLDGSGTYQLVNKKEL